MVLLCFLMDLRRMPPPLLRDLKQILLQLGNLYAISESSSTSESDLKDNRMGLCYVVPNRCSSVDELKIAYSPTGVFRLHDFHSAVKNLPADGLGPEVSDCEALCDIKISTVLKDNVLYSWGCKEMMRKVIVLTSRAPEVVDAAMKNSLLDAADMCVSVEFELFEQKSSHLSDTRRSVHNFLKSISDLDNCSIQTHLPDVRVYQRLLKRWVQDLIDDTQAPFQACLSFKSNLIGSMNHIFCELYMSVNQIFDGFEQCQTCRPQDIQVKDDVKRDIKELSCSVNGFDSETCDFTEKFLKSGEKTSLCLHTFKSLIKPHPVSSPICFNIIERTNLGSLCESALMGASVVVLPSSLDETESSSDNFYQLGMNAQVFHGLSVVLQSLDQGLICLSKYNTEAMKEDTFPCYYVLLPSDNGGMLLRRIAASEEFLCFPSFSPPVSVADEIKNSIKSSLLTVELRDYEPLLHDRGIHQKLNFLVEEGLQFRGPTPETKEGQFEKVSNQPDSSESIIDSSSAKDVANEEEGKLVIDFSKDDKTEAPNVEDWEQLVIHELPKIHSPVNLSKAEAADQLARKSPDKSQVCVKTSRILERLEAPRQLKRKTNAAIASGVYDTKPGTVSTQPQPVPPPDQSWSSTQLIRPNFIRQKKKQK